MNSSSPIDTADLKNRAAAMGVVLDPQQLEQFSRFSSLLSEWNEKLNLTAVPPAEYVERHFLDCLSMTHSPAWNPAGKLVDVGTGAGFPGIPLKIAFPALQLTLVESLQKRCNFLSAAVEALKLEGVQIFSERGEIVAHSPQLREKFDIACARAVASLSMLSEILLPYVKIGGAMIAIKGLEITDETGEAAEAIRVCGGEPAHIQTITLPESARSLSLVTVTKSRPTQSRLPRSYAAICKKPLRESR